MTTVLIALLLPALSLAQSQPESQTPVQKNVIYNLAVEPESMFVTEDCEGAEGNQGEWVYQVSLAAPGLSDARTGTRNYPSREGIVSWSDQTDYRLYDGKVELRGIAVQNLGSVEIKLQATEWDPESADPTMDDVAATQTIKFSEQTQKGIVELTGGRCAITLSYNASWAETRLPGVYDPLGNLVFDIDEGGRLHDAEGHTYVYDRQWEKVSRDGKNILEYHFNKRRWNYIEDLAVTTSPILADRIDKDLIERIYQREKGVLTATTQGKNPLLVYKDGKYFNEFGEHVYSVYGNFPEWTTIVMLHRYYGETFNGDDVDEYMARRAAAGEVFSSSNSLATDILSWTTKYKSRNKKKEVMYFAEADGEIFVLTDDKLQQVRNGWLILNEKPKMMSWPHYIPEASFSLSKGKAKKRGVQGVESRSFVLELKLVPEHMAEFRETVSMSH